MFVIAPFAERTTITEAMLTGTSVPEAAPAVFNAGTTYAAGAEVSVATGTVRDVYVSLQAGNTGHAPASSPAWWRLAGTTYVEWSGGATFALDDIVIVAAEHRMYRSAQASNTNHPPGTDDGTWWTDEGPTNRWAPFDLVRNTGATGPSPMTFEITPGVRVDSIGFAGIVADSYTVEVRRGGDLIYTRTERLSTRVVMGWKDYFTKPFTFRSVGAHFDLPLSTGAEITITLERATGDVTIGSIHPGRAVFLGEVEIDPNDGAKNYSTFTRNIEGTASQFVSRRVVPLRRLTTMSPPDIKPDLVAMRERLKDTPAFWCGLTDPRHPYFESFIMVAVWIGFEMIDGYPLLRTDLDLEEA